MGGCASNGGCPSDYLALSLSALSFPLLLARSVFPFLIYKQPIPKASAFWVPVTQIVASLCLLASVVMSVNLIKSEKRHWWQSCYIWAVWVEGPFGFGLLLSCRILQVYQLYFIFVKKRLPPMRSCIFLPLILLPWIAGAVFLHVKKPFNYQCQMTALWIVPIVFLHTSYVIILIVLTRSIRHVDFRFHELKDLWRGVLVSTASVGFWVVAYTLNEIHENLEWLRVGSRFLLALMTSIFVLAFFSLSSSQPLLSQISLRKRERPEFETMGQALGIHDNGILVHRERPVTGDYNEPLDRLLLDKRFRESFMAFADSCLAGESVHFYDEVHEFGKLHEDDSVRRIYMARHIIQKYIVAGAPMEVNISHRTRQEILNTDDLARPDLFKRALNELLQLMKTNLLRDYWSSIFYLKFKEEAGAKANGNDLELLSSWNVSPRLSCVQASDDPFHQDHLLKGSSHSSHELQRENNLYKSKIMVTAGANQAFVNLVLALCDAGDSVVMFAPYYFNAYMSFQMTGVSNILVGPGDPKTLYPDADWLEQTLKKSSPAPKVVTVVNPGNPSGTYIPEPLLKRISDLCRDAGSWLIVDNTYEYFMYDGRKHSCIEGDHIVNIFSFSKAYGMMGWRVGYIAYPSEVDGFLEQLLKVQDNIPICASIISQYLAVFSLEVGTDWVRDQIKDLIKNRELVKEALSVLGEDSVQGGEGAIYLWAKLPDKFRDDFEVVRWLARRHRIILIPGSACGCPGHLRISFGGLPEAETAVAAERLRKGLEELLRDGILEG